MSSTPPRPAGFYYDPWGYIRPRRYFDHEGRPLPKNTKETSYAPIPSWSPSNPTFTKPPHHHPALGRKEQHSLRWWLLREKAKKACTHAIQLAHLVEQLQKMVNMHSASQQSTKSVEPPKDQPSGNRQRATMMVREWLEHGRVLGPEEDANGTASPPEPPRCRGRGRRLRSRSTSPPVWNSSPPPDLPKTRKVEFKVEIHFQKVQRFVVW